MIFKQLKPTQATFFVFVFVTPFCCELLFVSTKAILGHSYICVCGTNSVEHSYFVCDHVICFVFV